MRHRRQAHQGAFPRGSLSLGATAFFVFFAAASARAGFWGRDSIGGWAAKPVVVDGDDGEWPEGGAYEDGGLGVQALNDGKNLYLKVTSSTREGRAQIIGLTKQDVGFVFYAADGKTKSWGLRVPFSRRKPPDEDELRYGPVAGDPSSAVRPDLVFYSTPTVRGAPTVSTAAWPDDMEFRIGFTGLRPVWEMRIPLSRLARDAKGGYPLDFYIVGKARRLRPRRPRPARSGAPTPAPSGESAAALDPVKFILEAYLARDPSLPR